MSKIPVETVVEDQTFLTRVETRYIEDGKRTHSSGAVRRGDEEGKMDLVGKQLRGETPTEPYERETHKVIRKGNEESGKGDYFDEGTPRQKRDLSR